MKDHSLITMFYKNWSHVYYVSFFKFWVQNKWIDYLFHGSTFTDLTWKPFLFFSFCLSFSFVAIPGGAQGFLLTLSSRITNGRFGGPFAVEGIKFRSVTTVTWNRKGQHTVLFLWLQTWKFVYIFRNIFLHLYQILNLSLCWLCQLTRIKFHALVC